MKWCDMFVYDESSPTGLRWKHNRYSGKDYRRVHIAAMDVAGSVTSRGYFQVRTKINGKVKNILCHRVVYEMFNGEIPSGLFIDHIDGDKSNNRLSNLRAVRRSRNARNAKKRADNTSGVTGVCITTTRDGNSYWSARCEGLNRTILQKRFSIAKLGNDEAFRQACEWRASMIEQLNAEGAGYTERHGKE